MVVPAPMVALVTSWIERVRTPSAPRFSFALTTTPGGLELRLGAHHHRFADGHVGLRFLRDRGWWCCCRWSPCWRPAPPGSVTGVGSVSSGLLFCSEHWTAPTHCGSATTMLHDGQTDERHHGHAMRDHRATSVRTAGLHASSASCPDADRCLDEAVARLGDHHGDGHRHHELGERQRDLRLLADDLEDRPVVQVQAVAAGADPLQERVAEQARRRHRVPMGDGGDDEQRRDPVRRTHRGTATGCTGPSRTGTWSTNQVGEEQQSDGGEHVELAALLSERATEDGRRAPQHGEPGAEQQAAGPGDASRGRASR